MCLKSCALLGKHALMSISIMRRGKFAHLEDLSCKIKAGCTDHLPWPAAICTKCQPSAITLARQVILELFRHACQSLSCS